MLTGNFDADEYREYTHAATTPSLKAAWPDQWVDWGDHTVTVDPVGNKQWIDDSHDRHFATEERGRHLDRREVQRLVGWEAAHTMPSFKFSNPSTSEINRSSLYSEPRKTYNSKTGSIDPTGCRMWRGAVRDPSNYGKLPTIQALIHENRLGDKGRGQIEAEIREDRHRRDARFFDCGGTCR